MAQQWIREYDAKKLRSEFLGLDYQWTLIESDHDREKIRDGWQQSETQRYVIKPDQLFGKRGKHGLLWINLSLSEARDRRSQCNQTMKKINNVEDTLTTFLVEPFVAHETEYYLALKTERDHDLLLFSAQWWVDVEENRDQIAQLPVSLWEQPDHQAIHSLLGTHATDELVSYTQKLLEFFQQSWCVYLEINPLAVDDHGNLHALDMVAKVDTCESYRQPSRKNVGRTQPFGTHWYPEEEYMSSVDAKTGASLKLTIINPHWSIWLLLGGGWASVIIMDTLANQWLLPYVWNYGELSWNPDIDSNRQYISTLLQLMMKQDHAKQYLCVVWWIANFTHIDKLCQAIVDILTEYVVILKQKNIHLLVRRWWINDTQWLAMIQAFGERYAIPVEIADGESYLTTILQSITL